MVRKLELTSRASDQDLGDNDRPPQWICHGQVSMSQIDDQKYLSRWQYRTPGKLAVRAAIHERFSTSAQRWSGWVFDQLDLQPGERVLEVGAGPAWLWRENRARLPVGLRVVLSDISPGMMQEARTPLRSLSGFAFSVVDAAALPFPDASVDVVVANHMLYHVPDVAQAVSEFKRVLRRGGRLLASTNGSRHLRELHHLIREVVPQYSVNFARNGAFPLENAVTALAVIGPADLRRFDDSLWVTEAEPLAAYIASLWDCEGLIGNWEQALSRLIRARIEANGGIRITKDSGLVIAVKGD